MGAAVVANSKLAKVVAPALDKVVKNAAWRKHGKLVQDCKAVLDKLASPEAAPSASPPPPPPPPSPAASNGNDAPPENGASGDATETTPEFDSPVFDEGKCYSLADAELIITPLCMACETLSPKVVEPALDCFQKLIAHGHLRGEMDTGSDSGGGKLLQQVMESVSKCYDMGDGDIELLVLKTLLSAVTSSSLRVHGECLLKAVRTCYNVFLGSKSPVNQTTAKASLTQMLVIVFRRMEADSSTVPVSPIVVADLMDPSERPSSDASVTQFVQGFITKVVQDIEVVLSTVPPLKTKEHDGAFDATASESSNPTDILGSTDKGVLDAKYWEISMYKTALEGRKGEFLDVDGDKDGDLEVQMTNKLRQDAFLVFRALCKLSMQNPPQEGNSDPFSLRGKIVALELLKILLENAGAVFRTSDRFLGAIKQYLCLSLLKNIASPMMNVFQLSCSIVMSLVSRFRAALKAEIGVFFPMIVLRVLENVAHPNYQQKTIVLRFLEKLCVDPQILVDIFVNYDCDVDSSNIFERMVNGLLKTAQGVPPGAEATLDPQQDAALKLAAIKCLVGVLRSMGDWLNRQLRLAESPYLKADDTDDNTSESSGGGAGHAPEGAEENTPGEEGETSSEAGPETSEATSFEQRRAYKLEFQEGISLFNKKPRKGIEFLIKAEKLGSSPEDIATFLKSTTGLDKTKIGDYLGIKEDPSLKVMHSYVDSFNFEEMNFDEAIRSFLLGFRLPGEAFIIDRIMEKFASRFCKCNPTSFASADTAYVLAYSIIMLNTDAHSPMVKSKMSKAEFIRNNRGIDDGKDLPEDFMSALYDRILSDEIEMQAGSFVPSKQPTNVNRFPGLDHVLNLVIRKPRELSVVLETSDDVIRHMQEQFKAKAGKPELVYYYAATDVELLRPMVDVTWAPMLAAFSVPLDKSEDEIVTFQRLEGFRHAIHITSVLTLRTQRDAFITSLAKFTSLHSAADIKQKNIDAIKAIISIADADGNYLQEAWEHILSCVSRFEHLRLIGEGAPPDATFFAAPQSEAEKTVKTPVLPFLRRKAGGSRLQHAAAAARRGSYDSAGVGESSAGVVTTKQMNNLVSNLNMFGSFEMNQIFTRSQRLNSEAIVDFVKALCKVSMEELRSTSDPRVFSLTKVVEIAHFNMTRIRLVWSRIWYVLSDFFVTLGCSDNLSVAMYAMDSLRQLAMKFLEREELANYNFQNEFMKPFVIVMRKSRSVEVRELIIRCVSQMVFARVAQVKSGWKIVFMVFTTAATDEHKSIVILAFETIEKIVREYFPYITETESTTFTDCVNCLIAFTNSRSNKDFSLNAIALLRFCALKLAEGELGVLSDEPDNEEDQDGPEFSDKEDHDVYFWFPLLAGLSELSFDPRPDIRKSALEILFDTLRFHGHVFTPALWERVFDSVLFPIFDYVRRATDSAAVHVKGFPEKDEAELEMYETCTVALQLVVDLFEKFYPVVNTLLSRVLTLLTTFIKRPHQSLAAVGVAAFVRLLSDAGDLFSDEKWEEVLQALQETATETLPDLEKLVACAAELQAARLAEERSSSGLRLIKPEDTAARPEFEMEQTNRLQCMISDVRCRTAVQLLLIQAITEVYDMHGAQLSAVHTMVLLDTLQEIAVHAYSVNGNHELREQLEHLRMATQMPDPPLLRLENDSYHAYLTTLQQLTVDKPELAEDVEVETRLVELCEDVLKVYVLTSTSPLTSVPGSQPFNEKSDVPKWAVPLGSARRRELLARAPLVVATLQAVSALKDSSFERYLVRFFPLLAGLISCEHGSGDVQIVLSDMFSSWIGPILLQAY